MPENYGALGAFNEQGQLNIPTQAAADYIAKQGQVTASQPQDDSWLSAVLSMNQKLGSGIIDVGQGLVHGATVGAANINKLIPGATWLGRQADDALRYVGVDPVVPEPKSTAGGLASGVAQPLLGIIPAVSALRVAGWAPLAADLLGGLIGDFAASSKKDAKGIADLIGMIPGESSKEVSKTLNDFIKSDNASFEDLKARMVAALPGVVFTPVVNGLVRYAMKVKNNLATDNFTGTLRKPPVEEEAIPIGFTPDQPEQLGALPKPPEAEPIAVPAIDLSPEGFFSAMSRAVDALPMEKGGGAQMRAMIAKGEGVKAEEMAWTGLDEFLKGKKSVTKAEIKEFTDANQVRVEEVVKDSRYEVAMRQYEADREGLQLIDRELEFLQQAPESVEREAKVAALRQEYDELVDELADSNRFLSNSAPNYPGDVLPGGENYREVLLTLPETRSTISNAELARLDELADKRIANSLDGLTDAEQKEYIDLVVKVEEKGQFREGHFNEPNVLAHIRLNDRTGPNGEKILFVEEIQSDWHQKGRVRGYRGTDIMYSVHRTDSTGIGVYPSFPTPAEAEAFLERLPKFKTTPKVSLEERVSANGLREYRLLSDDGEAGGLWRSDRAEVEAAVEKQNAKPDREIEYRIVEDTINQEGRVPDAPLKKTWEQTSLRRVIRMAAEEGYDSVAWTPGNVQNARYFLSDKIEAINYDPDAQKLLAYERDGYSPVINETISKDKLADRIGKDAAEKLLATKRETIPTSAGDTSQHSLEGLDLEVGGEGMKGFYDKELVNYAKKFGKKFDAKVETTKIQTGENTYNVFDEDGVLDSNVTEGRVDEVVSEWRRDGAIGVGKVVQDDRGKEVWSMPITPKMRESVMKKGVPLFGVAGLAATAGMQGQDRNGL